jgi:hypothetical protein
MPKIFMPAGRSSADRRIVGCWLYQRNAFLFIGARNPYYWIEVDLVKERGVDWWVEHIKGKPWFDGDGWTVDEAERHFRSIMIEVCGPVPQ